MGAIDPDADGIADTQITVGRPDHVDRAGEAPSSQVPKMLVPSARTGSLARSATAQTRQCVEVPLR